MSDDHSISVVLYDGLCGLCNRLNQFILKRDLHDRFRFASLQSDIAAKLLQRHGGTVMGDGYRMAKALGAATTSEMGNFYGHLHSREAMIDARLWPRPQADDLAAASIVIDTQGKRVSDEGYGGIHLGVRAGVAAWLDVSSKNGRVRSSLQSDPAAAASTETVTVRARTQWGDIDIERNA